MIPFNILPTQVQGFRNAASLQVPHYSGLVHCISSVYKEEGVLGFYRGALPSLLKVWLCVHCLSMPLLCVFLSSTLPTVLRSVFRLIPALFLPVCMFIWEKDYFSTTDWVSTSIFMRCRYKSINGSLIANFFSHQIYQSNVFYQVAVSACYCHCSKGDNTDIIYKLSQLIIKTKGVNICSLKTKLVWNIKCTIRPVGRTPFHYLMKSNF